MTDTIIRNQAAERSESLLLLQQPYIEARQFWRTLWPLLERKARTASCVKIVLLNPEETLFPVLAQGLLHNLFHPQQKLQYILVDTPGNLSVLQTLIQGWNHSLLKDEMIPIPVCDTEIARAAAESADLLVLFQAGPFCKNTRERTSVHYYSETDRKQMAVLQTSLVIQGQWIHSDYLKAQEDAAEQRYPDWDELSASIRCSNISAASITEVWDLLRGLHPDQNDEQLELAVLEHIRWCRFRTLFPSSAEMENQSLRQQHESMMVPYEQLSVPLQEKDIQNARKSWHSFDAEQKTDFLTPQ